MNKKGVLIAGVPSPLSPTPLPFSLFPYPLPLSTQAKHWIQYQSLGQVWQRIWKIASSSLVWTKVKVSSFFFFLREACGKREKGRPDSSTSWVVCQQPIRQYWFCYLCVAFGWGAQFRRLIKPGFSHSYLRILAPLKCQANPVPYPCMPLGLTFSLLSTSLDLKVPNISSRWPRCNLFWSCSHYQHFLKHNLLSFVFRFKLITSLVLVCLGCVSRSEDVKTSLNINRL